MALQLHRSRTLKLLTTTLVGAAMISPAAASASAARAHADKAGHQASTSTHKTAAHRKARPVKVTHHKKTLAASLAGSSSGSVYTPAPSPAPAPSQAPEPVAYAASTAACTDGGLAPTPANVAQVRSATLCLINQQRAAAGLGPLRENSSLDAAAQNHSDDMVSTNYFDHDTPSGVDPLSRVVAAGFAPVAGVLDLGENIAAGAGSLSTPVATVANWMNSAPHRANILDPAFRQTGIGVTAGVPSMLGIGSSGATYTETFGTTA